MTKRHVPQNQNPKRQTKQRSGTRFYIIGLLFILLAGFMVGKLIYVQVIDTSHLKKKAQGARNQSLALYHRGRILDRNGAILAQDTPLYDIYAHPKYFWDVKPHRIAKALAPILQKSQRTMARKLSQNTFTITLAKNIHKSLVQQILDARLAIPQLNEKTNELLRLPDGEVMTKKIPIPGLDFYKKTVRTYPQGQLAAHLLGYVNDEANISSGVEETAKDVLRKRPADSQRALLDGRGGFIHMEDMDPDTMVNIPEAEDLALTIDAKLQYIAERELKAGLERTKAKRGSVIMMNPTTGEILAFAVLPTYMPERYFKAPASNLKNWSITDVYPPGSTFKILTVACGLESGVINEKSHIEDTGQMKIGGWTIQNYDYYRRPYPGSIDLVYLFQHSSNIASAKIAMMMDPSKYHSLLKQFGLGSRTGIDLPGESAGLIQPVSDWSRSTQANMGFGYAVATTPLQMASAVAAIANGGEWITPHVIKDNKKVEKRRILSTKTAATVTKLLTESIDRSKRSPTYLEEFHVAGKTGTSRKPSDDGKGYQNALYTSFVGFFPAERPELLVMVVVDSPSIGAAWGSTVAAPIFRAIAKESIHYLNLKPVTISELPADAASTSTALNE
ncbi:MAG: penicillin-binding protein 2 [Vampirovibrio sp.]|nr:penicillin-binding protein 2 [Vampirovibrio sp.]